MSYNGGMRVSAYQRSLSLMALVAILLIVLAPLVSRWIAQGTGAVHREAVQAVERSLPAMQQHHADEHHHHGGDDTPTRAMSGAHDGHAMAAQADAHAVQDHAGSTRNDPHAGHDMGVDCDYCLIAARMVSLLVALLIALIGWCPPRFTRVWALSWVSRIAAGHLGARGPPSHA